MNLHVGSGNHPSNLPGWIDIDLEINAAGPPTVLGSAVALPFPAASFERIYLGHLLEHLRWEDELLDVLAEVRRVATSDALIMVVGPDIEKAVDTGQPDWLLRIIIRGGPANTPGTHQWVATEALTVRALRLGGFTNVTPVDVATVAKPEWPNSVTDPWQCAVTATR